MKKRYYSSVILSLVAILAIVGSALAATDALPGSGWYTASIIQNVSGADTLVTMTAYDKNSTNTYEISSNVASGANIVFGPGNFTDLPSGFQGSAVVTAAADIRAIVTLTNRYDPGSGAGDATTPSPGAGQYQGMNEPSTTLAFPSIKNNSFGKSTTVFIQNAGGTAATAQCLFIINGVTYNYTTALIQPNRMVVVTPTDAGVPTGDAQKGSLTVTSTQALAGAVLEHKTTEVVGTIVQAARAFTPADYDTEIYAPTNKNNRFNRFTGLMVQNVSGGAVNVTVTYKGTAGTCAGNTYTDTKTGLAANASHTFPASALPNDCNASATVVATGDIVGMVNESYTSAFLAANPSQAQESITYACLGKTSATQVVSLPLFKEDARSKATGVTVQNVGTVVAHFSVTIKNTVGTFTTISYTLDPGKAKVFLDMRKLPASEWVGTALTPALLGCTNTEVGCGGNGNFGMVITSADQPLIAIAQESTYPNLAPRIDQDKSTYEGFNLTSAP